MRQRRLKLIIGLIIALISYAGYQSFDYFDNVPAAVNQTGEQSAELRVMYAAAEKNLAQLEVKGRAPKTDYSRAQFGDGWDKVGSCDMRNIILNRDLKDTVVDDNCKVQSGLLTDPYTGTTIKFTRGPTTSDDVQIDHVVALSDAWQKGAQQLSFNERQKFANDPLNLLAVDGASNQAKSDSDAASWLPANRTFRCQYVSRQVEVKTKYNLWVTEAEKQTISRVLGQCL